jgi:hypothetical protein
LQIRTVRAGERISLWQVHLPMQNIHPFNSKLSGFVDHRFDGDFFGLKVPIGISGNAEFDLFLFSRADDLVSAGAAFKAIAPATPAAVVRNVRRFTLFIILSGRIFGIRSGPL